MRYMKKKSILLFLSLIASNLLSAQEFSRSLISLNQGWQSTVSDDNPQAQDGFQDKKHDCTGWEKVNIPHNWDTYEGYRRLLHGNRHGTAWYRKTFSINNPDPDNRYFLFFEGVGSYATVYLNGDEVGYHAGGRTTFTLDVTNSIHTDGSDNLLAEIGRASCRERVFRTV